MTCPTHTWGSTPEERALPFPVDRHVLAHDAALFRAVTIRAPASVVFRWLCQMRVAPYSYDWIDNGGRRSPRALTPGLEALAVGQEVRRIFDLIEFERDRHVTIRMSARTPAPRVFGDVASRTSSARPVPTRAG